MNETLYNEEKLRNFLLGNVSEDERGAIEDRFLADEDFSAQLLVVEDDLIEAYLKQQLSTREERKAFEKAFLTSPRRRERVVAMKALIKAATAEANLMKARLSRDESPSLWATLIAFLRFENAYVRYALAAAALIIFSGGAWLVVNMLNQNSNTQVAQNSNTPQTTPTISTSPSPGGTQAEQTPPPVVTPSPHTHPQPPPQPKVQPKQQPAGPMLATILYATHVRDPNAGDKKLVLSSSDKKVHLKLSLEHNDYKSYIARITTVDGRFVWEHGPIRARTTNAGTYVDVYPAARLLETDDYIVELSGVSEAGPPESFANYSFSVRRK